ncbi:myb-like protein D, partial [Chironomus tepperi]|uniref:myb-like protein D n=1 Tax=Chironomus tepperi TaxID=113505 RepID=UPI00391F164C
KLKNTDQVNDNNLATVSLPSTCPLSPTVQLPTTFSSGSIPSHVSSAHSLPIESKLTDNVNNSVSNEVLLEYAPNDASTTMILEIEKMLQRMKTEIIEELKREIKIQVLSALSSGRTNGRDLSSFEKIKSKIDFQEFVEKLNDTTTKNNMASMLKLLHDSSGCYKSANGRIATIMTYLFSNEFIKKELAWGSMNGHKRKVQNFLPCKTPSRNALDPSVIPVGQSLTYEDPDMHLGHHRPLVMRQHPLNAEMLHSKGIHYPGGYPIQGTPPLFICSSPGPEPYRSNDNVYEELEHRGNNRYQNCDRQMHSDEDFAEDELSLPGDRSLNKSSSENTTVATIYQEHGAGSTSSNNGNETSAIYMERNRLERNSLLSSASSNDNSNNNFSNVMRPNMKNSSSTNESNSRRMHHHNLYHNTLNSQNNDKNGNNNVNNNSNSNSSMSNFFRFRTSRPSNGCSSSGKSKNNNHHHRSGGGKTNNFSMNNLNSSGCDEIPLSSYHVGGSSSSAASNSDPISCSSNANHIDGDTNNNSNNGGNSGRNNYYGIDSEVERRNRINAQLSAATPTLNVATIFRDRNSMRNYHHNHQNINNNNNNSSNTTETRANANYYVPQQHIMMMAANRNDANNRLSRTNPRTDRRQNNNNNNNNSSNNSNNNNLNNNDEYLYHEPVYHDNVVYDPYIISSDNRNQIYHQPYMLPEFTTFRNCNNLNNPQQPLYNSSTTGAMNSDSGYSQNTQNSGHSLWNRRKRNGGINNNNNDNENGDSITSTVRGETTATDDTYECS